MTGAMWPWCRAAIVTAGGLLVVVILAACGAGGQSATSGQTSSAASAGSFLGRPSNGVIYVDWTSTASGLAGTLYTDLVGHGGGGHETLDAERLALSRGTVIGRRINLSLASGAKISGTLSGANLILDYPVDSPGQVGIIIEPPMHQANVGDYERALAVLRNRVASANATS